MEIQKIDAFDIARPQQALEVASTLQRFVSEKKLTATIQGKQYPLVEAWQFAGSQLGMIPILKDIKNLSTEDEIKYEAMVEVIRLSDGLIVSRGYAVCSNKEHSKRRFDEYAIASMSQTRAVGKAYRNVLAWLMKAAGFEPTPAEEMDFVRDEVKDEGREYLLELLTTSSYPIEVRTKLAARISDIMTKDEFEKAKNQLQKNQK
jgi:hypothetical protein